MASDEAEESSKAPRRTSSKYDFVKVKVWIGENSDHYYVLSRFLVSRMLTVTKISNVVAIKIALELKKLLVDNNLLDVSQADLEANLFKLMQKRGYGDEYVNRYKMMTNFHHQRVPLLVLVAGTACVGKSTIATQLAQRLNLPNVLQTDIIYELLRTDPNNAAPLNATPLWARTDVTSTEDLMQEFRRECRVVRKGVDGDLTKTLSDGKPLIMEGLHLDPGIYLTELPQMRVRNPGRLKQVKVHPSESLTVPQTTDKPEFSKPDPVQMGSNLGETTCSEPRADETGSSRELRLHETGLRRGLGFEQERDGAQRAEMEKRALLTSASGSGRVETRAGETADGFHTGKRSVTSRRLQKRSRGRTQSLADAKDFLKSLAAKSLGEAETRVGPKSGVKKSASSCHVAGELGMSPQGTDPGMPKWSELGRPQESPRGLSELQASTRGLSKIPASSAGRSTGSDGKKCAAERKDRAGVTSLVQSGEETPIAGGLGGLDTSTGGAGRGQLEAPAGVNSLRPPTDSTVLSQQAEGDVGVLEGRHAGREPLSFVAQRVAADSCPSTGDSLSRGDQKSGAGPSNSGSVSETRPYERSERGGVQSDRARGNENTSESHQSAGEQKHADPMPSGAGPSEESTKPSPSRRCSRGSSDQPRTAEPRSNAGRAPSSQSDPGVGDGIKLSGRSEPGVGTGLSERSKADIRNCPPECSDSGSRRESAGRLKQDGEPVPPERSEVVAGNASSGRSVRGNERGPVGPSEECLSEVVAGKAPFGRAENGDPKAGPDEAIVVQIVLRMSEEDHSALLDEWLASRRGTVDGDVMLEKAAVLQKLRTIQDYLCSFEDQGVAVVDVSTTSFAQTLDQLHSHLLECIEGGWSGADR